MKSNVCVNNALVLLVKVQDEIVAFVSITDGRNKVKNMIPSSFDHRIISLFVSSASCGV